MRFSRHGWLRIVSTIFFFSSLSAFSQEKTWAPLAGKCGLSKFKLENREYDELNPFGRRGRIRGTSMSAVVETSDPSCLREYAVVQYIRGCLYNVRYQRTKDQVTERYFGSVRQQRGKAIPFAYADWAVDTVDEDPVYHSRSDVTKTGENRLDSYRFSANRYSLTDLPTFADWMPAENRGAEEEWTNASLEFQTCVYRTKDVPAHGDPKLPGALAEVGGPIACLPWQHKQTFDPKTNAFRAHAGIDPACRAIAARERAYFVSSR